MILSASPFSFFYRVSKCGYKLFNSLFTDVYASDSSAKIALFTEMLQNLTAPVKLFIVTFFWELTYLEIFFGILQFLGIVLASFIQGVHLQAAVVTYPNLQIYRKYFCRLIIVDVTAGSNCFLTLWADETVWYEFACLKLLSVADRLRSKPARRFELNVLIHLRV